MSLLKLCVIVLTYSHALLYCIYSSFLATVTVLQSESMIYAIKPAEQTKTICFSQNASGQTVIIFLLTLIRRSISAVYMRAFYYVWALSLSLALSRSLFTSFYKNFSDVCVCVVFSILCKWIWFCVDVLWMMRLWWSPVIQVMAFQERLHLEKQGLAEDTWGGFTFSFKRPLHVSLTYERKQMYFWGRPCSDLVLSFALCQPITSGPP